MSQFPLDNLISRVRHLIENQIIYCVGFDQSRAPGLIDLFTWAEIGINWHAVTAVKDIEDMWHMKIRPNAVWADFLLSMTRKIRLYLECDSMLMTWDDLVMKMVASMDVYGSSGDRIAIDGHINRYPTADKWKELFMKNPWLVSLFLIGYAEPTFTAAEIAKAMKPAKNKQGNAEPATK